MYVLLTLSSCMHVRLIAHSSVVIF